MSHSFSSLLVLAACSLGSPFARADDTVPLRAALCDVLLDRWSLLARAQVVDVRNGEPFLKGLNPARAALAQVHALAGRESTFTPSSFFDGDGQTVPQWLAENLAQAARSTDYQAHEIRGKTRIADFLAAAGPFLESTKPRYAGRDKIDGHMMLGGTVAAIEILGVGLFWADATSIVGAVEALGGTALIGGAWWWLSYAFRHERHASELPALAAWLDRVGYLRNDVLITTFKLVRGRADERPALQILREDSRARPPKSLLTYAGRQVYRLLRRPRGPKAYFWNYAYWDDVRREPVLLIGIPRGS